MKCPCYGCTDERAIDCHAKCSRYRKYKIWRQKRKDELRRKNSPVVEKIERCIFWNRYLSKHRRG